MHADSSTQNNNEMIIDDTWTNYDRHPIVLNPHSVMLIEIFTRTDRLDDFWKHDVVERWSVHQEAAKQFMLQLEGQGCDAFLEELRDLINEYLKG